MSSPSRDHARSVLVAASLAIFAGVLVLTNALSCGREKRSFGSSSTASAVAVSGPQGGALHAGPGPESLRVTSGDRPGRYEETANAVSEGQQLFTSFNCGGCHSDGGGGMGANLMDARWYYGHEPQQIFDTIVQGRPNGMPAFGGRIPAYQIWELVAYVRNLSGLVSPDAASGRSDHMEVRPPPNSMRMRARLTVQPPARPDSAGPGKPAFRPAARGDSLL